jgi:hypothetical protein
MFSLFITVGAWYQRTQTLENTVIDLGEDVQKLNTSSVAVERSVKENREDTRLILEILLKGEPGRSHANISADTPRNLEVD